MSRSTFINICHWLIIFLFITQVFYAFYMVFFVVKPIDVAGPLWGNAKGMDFEMMVTRRLYAIEFWVSFGAMCIYLALTSFRSRD